MKLSSEELREHLHWFIAFRCPKEIWALHPSYLVIEIVVIICGLLTLKHAFKKGCQYPYFWIAAVLHGLVVESLSYILPNVDNFWHAQSTVMFWGLRLPLHIIFLYPVFIYGAYVAVSHMKLNCWAEPLAVGLAVVLLDVPFDILGIKFLWWTWHDTDPNIADRHYWVPWTSYYFHAAFAASFTFVFNLSRHLLIGGEKEKQTSRVIKSGIGALLTGLLATPLGVVQFAFLYHILHDWYSIHTEVSTLTFLSIYLLGVWTADRNPVVAARSGKGGFWYKDEIFFLIIIWYAVLSTLVLTVKPEHQRSVGLHEPIGPCGETVQMDTLLGSVLNKRKYLCLKDYDEPYYDFHCVSKEKSPLEDNDWYTICGTPYPNEMEYRVVIWTFCLIGVYVYHQLLNKSAIDVPARFTRKQQQKTKSS